MPSKPTVFRWTDERIQHLMRFVRAMQDHGFTAAEAWKRYAKWQGTTESSCMTLYYRGRKKGWDQLPALEWDEIPDEVKALPREEPAPEEERPTVATSGGEQVDVLDVLGRLGQVAPKVGLDLGPVFLTLAQLAERAVEARESQALRQHVAALEARLEESEREKAALRERVHDLTHHCAQLETIMRQRLDELDKQLARNKEAYDAVSYVVDEFTSMRGIEALTSLKSLRQKIKVETDKFGNVLRVTDEWKKAFERQLIELMSKREALEQDLSSNGAQPVAPQE